MFSKFRSLVFKINPETAHNLAIKSLKFNLVKNIFDRFSLNSILELVSEENKILLTLSYCEYKFSQQEFAEVESLASTNIRKIESFIKNKHTENFGWLITKRTLKVFKNKGLARQNLQKLVQNLTN